MPPPSSARTRSWLQFHPSKASGRGKHGSKSGRHSPLRAKNVLTGAVLAIAIGAPIVGFVGGHQDGAIDQRRMRRRAGRRRRTRISSTIAATPKVRISRQHSSCPMRARPSGRFARRDNEKNGARVSPADLPVHNPTKFNLTTAKALGLNTPLSLQERADSLIE